MSPSNKIRIDVNSPFAIRTSRNSSISSAGDELTELNKKPKIKYNIAHRLDFKNGKIDQSSKAFQKYLKTARIARRRSKKSNSDSSPLRLSPNKNSSDDSPFPHGSLKNEMKDAISPLPTPKANPPVIKAITMKRRKSSDQKANKHMNSYATTNILHQLPMRKGQSTMQQNDPSAFTPLMKTESRWRTNKFVPVKDMDKVREERKLKHEIN